MEELDKEDPLEKLWRSICLQEARIIYMQNIMHVKNKKDITKELKKVKSQYQLIPVKGKKDIPNAKSFDEFKANLNKADKEKIEMYREEEYEIQFAWDKEATLVNTQSNAFNTLVKLIKQYDEMLHNNWNLATDEQKLRIEKLKVDINKIKKPEDDKPIEVIIKRKGED